MAATRVGLQKNRSRESRLLFGSPESCALTDTSADVLRTRCGVLVLRAAHFYLMTRWILWVQPLSFGATTAEAGCDGSLEYEVKAIAGRIQAPSGRAMVNIGQMTTAPAPTKVDKMITVVIFTVT